MRTMISGGDVVTADNGVIAGCDVLLDGERILDVGVGLARLADDRVIDARGAVVLPGGIDVHTHLDMPFEDTSTCDDFASGHLAALHGGTTCHVDFAQQRRGGTLAEAVATWHDKAAGRALVDYGFHVVVSDPRPEVLAEIPDLVDAGTPTVKVYLAYPGELMVDDGTLFDVLERAARAGAMVMVHAENGYVIDRLQRRALEAGRVEPGQHWRTRPPEAEAEATNRAIALAGMAGATLYVVHVSCTQSLDAVRRGRADGVNVHAETCTHYLYLTRDALDAPGMGGARFVCSPPLRTAADGEDLWAALRDGDLELVSSDHCPYTYAQRLRGDGDFTRIPNGAPGIEERMPLLVTAAADGRLDWARLVELTATGPAHRFGMDHRKGRIAVGLDADLVVWRLDDRPTALAVGDLHGQTDYSMYEGLPVRASVEHAFVRGSHLIEGGTLTAAAVPGSGRFVHRTGPTPRPVHAPT